MKKYRFISFIFFILISIQVYSQTFHYDFENGIQGWIPDFADYNVGDSANWNLSWVHGAMPSILPVQNGISLSGDNLSDDLFMFIKRNINGLLPNTAYKVQFNIDMVTKDPPDGVGGCSCMLKAGASLYEPVKVDNNGFYELNIDKGNQWAPGNQMDTIGYLVHTYPGNFNYHLVSFDNSDHLFEITTDTTGSLWLITGAESAFEVPVEINFAQVTAIFYMQSAGYPFEGVIKNPILVYPNPSYDQIFIITKKKTSILELHIHDSHGRLISQFKPFFNSAIDISTIPAGIYFLNIVTDQGTFLQKLSIKK